jgi:hypothetical protein
MVVLSALVVVLTADSVVGATVVEAALVDVEAKEVLVM